MTRGPGSKYLFAILLPVSLLGGCFGGNPLSRLPPADETLIAQIHEDGSKFFLFTREYPVGWINGGEGPAARGPDRHAPETVTARLEQILEETAYCRDGHFELYRQSARESLTIRGECREAATDEDRQRFSAGEVVFHRPAR